MLSQISWQQFLAFFAVTGLLYYAVVIIIYYRRELILLLKDPLKFKNLGHETSLSLANNYRSVLGKAHHSQDFTTVSPENVTFSGNDFDKISPNEEFGKPNLQEVRLDIPSVSHLEEIRSFINELKNNLALIKDADGSKEEFNLLFSATASKFTALKTRPSIDYINLLTEEVVNSEKLGFVISADELNSLW